MRLFPRTVPVGFKYGTVGVLDRHRRLHEVTTFRRDVETDGRHAVVEYGVSLDEDLARRDFTINAIAYHPLRGEWRDPFGGEDDLERRVLRAVGDPAQRFREDYLRILRGLRFAARLGFSGRPATWDAARAASDGLSQFSAERVREEWFKSLHTARDLGVLVRLWRDSGVAGEWMPELEPGDSAPSIDLAERDPVLLTLPAHQRSGDGAATAQGLQPRDRASGGRAGCAATSRAERRRDGAAMACRVGTAADDYATLIRWRTGAPPAWAAVVARIRARGDALTRDGLAISGADLRAAGMEPGPMMGLVLDRLLDRVLEDPALNTREQLLALARTA